MTIRCFDNSVWLAKKAEEIIPSGSQTFSKSKIQYPYPQTPLFVEKAYGGRFQDIDGNIYVDLVCGLLPILLGYTDPDIDDAIMQQLKKGITFSLSSVLEYELAEQLIRLIPSAEMVRFAKNGSDATSAAIRIARAVTGRDHVIALGYHGWHDWYVGSTTRNLGVPQQVSQLTHRCEFNDIEQLHDLFLQNKGQVAAVILEAASSTLPHAGYLESVKALSHENGALLIFDEVVSGFRFDIGGAQSYFGITPDLSAFGKALGNGMPISAIVGRREYMKYLDHIFVSGTFGGEALSLAAAIAVIKKLEAEPVIERIWDSGKILYEGFMQIVSDNELCSVLSLKGLDCWRIIGVNDHENASALAIKTFLQKEMISRGILILGSHNVCYAHNSEDLELVLAAYAEVIPLLREELEKPGLENRLGVQVIEPIFKVRT